ncbi:hypothetical protein BV22DRAFT_1033021 [Leucogyrophana mollusca]|uniref:Uncharacterized protein n=1 Tax=Leucogyrophana mollusca TaxID=85980 RepID=A0ACB8BKG1_9AGAM|nr:hypothetical protein BV22DRAFT_1033021 [Leucogyrophana mollusca]
MKLALTSLTLFAAVAQSVLVINTPAIVLECEPTLLTWSGGKSPYFLTVNPGGDPSSPALECLGEQTGTSYTWTVNIASGTSVGLELRDSTGDVAYSAPFTIQPGTSTTCIN